LALPQFDYSVPGQSRIEWAQLSWWATEAERLGFSSLWLADHLSMSLVKYGGPAGEYAGFEPVATLGALARITERARLGTLVLCAPFRPAGVLAQQLAAVDILCGGRLSVGLGAGWNRAEFSAAGLPFESLAARLAHLAGVVTALRETWTGAPGAPPCLPKPVQAPHPPVLLGGKGDGLLRTVAATGTGWNTVWAWTREDWLGRSAFLDRACTDAGRDPATVHRSLGLFTLVGESEADLEARFAQLQRDTPPGVLDGVDLDGWRQGHLVGTPGQIAEQAAAWEEAGVETLIVGLGAVPFAATRGEDLALIASALRLS
jgi:alkanesulfonate monooxygenase SsuD/methylene tetrahydromethanopterin reductase-like flavin-dependent oxidoreductase (luciferase family)